MEIDKDIALLQRAYRESELEEEKNKELEKYDLRKKIKYTLAELKEGIKKGKQFLYTLRIEFEMKDILDGRVKIPYMVNLFDAVDDKPGNLFLASSQRKVSMDITVIPWASLVPMKDWMTSIKDSLEKINLHAQIGSPQIINQMEYFSYEVPTSEGITYNLTFRYHKEDELYLGTFNCMSEDKEGMGLLLEAVIQIFEEMNR